MLDENAFGLLIANPHLEDEEYGTDDPAEFVERFALFQRLVLAHIADSPVATDVRAMDMGHFVFLEFADDEANKPMQWVRELRGTLSEHGYESIVVLTHGGRWVPTEDATDVQQFHLGSRSAPSWGGPSEPLRRALYAHTACHGLSTEEDAWGPGFYLDTEAVDALGLRPKNAPTLLEVAGASFLRVSR